MKNNYENSIIACLKNGKSLLEDIEWLSYDRFSTTFYLSIIAQEEFSKALVLYLVMQGTMRWKNEAELIIKDHKSKQLLGFIIDYLEPEIEEWIERYKTENLLNLRNLPPKIYDALHTLVNEKIKKYSRNEWQRMEDVKIDKNVNKIAMGKFDQIKQDSLYVRLDKNGAVIRSPSEISKEQAEKEIERAKRLSKFIYIQNGKISGPSSLEYKYIDGVLKVLLQRISLEEYYENYT